MGVLHGRCLSRGPSLGSSLRGRIGTLDRVVVRSSVSVDEEGLLLPEDRVFGGFGDAELDHAFRGDLNFRAGLRISSHAGFPIH